MQYATGGQKAKETFSGLTERQYVQSRGVQFME